MDSHKFGCSRGERNKRVKPVGLHICLFRATVGFGAPTPKKRDGGGGFGIFLKKMSERPV